MKQSIAILSSFLFVITLQAQQQYLDSIFSEIDISTHHYKTPTTDTLQFDYYRAKGVTASLPLIVVVHGGGFVSGKRNSEDMVKFSTKLAQHGYAVASMSYRLTMKGIGFGCDVKAQQKIGAINAASDDIRYALKSILDATETFNIDKNK